MSIYRIPKQLHADFSRPGVKPKFDVELDLSNSITKNLLLSVEMTEGAGAPRDLVTGRKLSENGQGWGISGGDRETTYSATGDNSVDITGLSDFAGSAHTLHMRVRVSAYDNSGTVIFGWNNNGSHFWQVDDVSTTVFVAGADLSTLRLPHEGATNNYRDWFFVSDPATNETRFYENGVLLNTKNNAAAIPSGSKDIKIGRWAGSNTFSLDGGIKFCRAWNRALTEAERISLLNDPYQILKPKTPQFYFVLGASGTYALTADSGSFTLTGTAAALKASRTIAANSENYTLTGSSAGLVAGRSVTAGSGTFTLTGTAATLTYTPVSGTYTLVAKAGSLALLGTAASLIRDAKLTVSSGAYTVTGEVAGLKKGYSVTADSGTYSYSGQTVSWLRSYVISAASDSFTLTGVNAHFTYSAIVSITPTPFTIYAQHRPIEVRSDAAPFLIVSGR